MRFLLLALGILLAAPAHAQAMRQAAEVLLATVPQAMRVKMLRPFDERERLDWHYTPRARNGVALKELDARGRDAVHALLKTALSAPGYRKAVNIIELELVLREIETFGMMRDPERYHLSLYGVPNPRQPGAGASRGTTCRSISRSRATAPRWIRRAFSAPIRRA